MGAGAEKPSDSGRTNNRQQLPQKHLLARSFLTIRTLSLSKKPSLRTGLGASVRRNFQRVERNSGMFSLNTIPLNFLTVTEWSEMLLHCKMFVCISRK